MATSCKAALKSAERRDGGHGRCRDCQYAAGKTRYCGVTGRLEFGCVASPSFLVNSTVKLRHKRDAKLEDVVAFKEYKARVSKRVTVFRKGEGKKRRLLFASGRCFSRYFHEGRIGVKSRLRRRLGRWWRSDGVFLTLTYDPKRISKPDAWKRVSSDRSRLIKSLNRQRYRLGWRPLKGVWSLEAQRKTGYPHIHYFFPGLLYLASGEHLNRVWSHGRTQVTRAHSANVASYVCKYLTKMDGMGDIESMFLWYYGMRMYAYSTAYRLPDLGGTRYPIEYVTATRLDAVPNVMALVGKYYEGAECKGFS